jgi:CRISPR-associated endoribonuclease Cas6
MRLYFKTSKNTEVIPWNYQHLLVGTIHKWMGKGNSEHDSGPSLYSISWLSGATASKEGLHFKEGAYFFFSAHSGDLCDKIITGVKDSSNMFCGMRVDEIAIANRPNFRDREKFYSSSPILVRRKIEDKIEHLHWDKDASDLRLNEIMQTKMKIAKLTGQINIRFDRSFQGAKTKLVNYKGIMNKANICPVIIKGDPEIIRFAYNVGIGESTGAAFGSIKL